MTCRTVGFVVAIRGNVGAAWNAGVDQPHHRDHLARDFLLGILVGCEIALHVTMRALHTKSLVEALHDESDFGFRIQQFQILRRWQWSRPTSAPAAFLSEQRTGQQKQNNDEWLHWSPFFCVFIHFKLSALSGSITTRTISVFSLTSYPGRCGTPTGMIIISPGTYFCAV